MLEYRAEVIGETLATEVRSAEEKVRQLNAHYAEYSNLSALQEKLASMKSTSVALLSENQKVPLPEALYGEFKAAVIEVLDARLTFLETTIKGMIK